MSRDHEDTETHTSKDLSPIHGSLDNCLEFSAAFSLGNLHQILGFFPTDCLPIQSPLLPKEERKKTMENENSNVIIFPFASHLTSKQTLGCFLESSCEH